MTKRNEYGVQDPGERLKVTLEIPRSLLKRIKLLAVEQECPMRELVELAIREFLENRKHGVLGAERQTDRA